MGFSCVFTSVVCGLYSCVAGYLFCGCGLFVFVLFSFVDPIQFGLCFALGLGFAGSCCLCIWFGAFLVVYVYE